MKITSNSTVIVYSTGRSLVEVMIALTLGMVVLLAVSALFVANKQTSRVTDDKARMEQEGRLAINLMAFHLRMAGSGTLIGSYPTLPDKSTPKFLPKKAVITNLSGGFSGVSASTTYIRGCSNGFVNNKATIDTLACVAPTNTVADKDSITVRYVVDAQNGNVSGGVPVDCLGAAVLPTPDPDNPGIAPDFYVVENRFFVRNNAVTGTSELYCLGNGTAPPGGNLVNSEQPIAENVEQFRVTYGVSSTGGQNVNQQLTATQVSAQVGNPWDNVVSARLCVVMVSANNGVANATQQYRDCNDVLRVAPDLRLRTVYSSVVTIRAKAAGNL